MARGLTGRVKRTRRDKTRLRPFRLALAMLPLGVGLALGARAASPLQVSGIYPHLAFFNDEAECGTGAVVPWADRLWAVTYAPHQPRGSSDKLYEVTPDLRLIVRPESVGGEIRLDWQKKGADAVHIYGRLRGQANWVLLGMDTSSPYIDGRPLAQPNVAEVREYMLRGVVEDVEIGLDSDVLNATWGGQ